MPPLPEAQFVEQEVGPEENLNDAVTDWSKSYFGLSTQAFSKDIADILLAPIDPMDVEMKPGAWVSLYALLVLIQLFRQTG